MQEKRNIVVFLVLACVLAMVPGSGYSQDIDTADIYVTPKTGPDFFSGYIGGDGDLSNPYESIDWSIGNSRPFAGTRTDDMVFSTCEGEVADPEAWKERMRITKSGDVAIGTPKASARLHVHTPEVTSDVFKVDSGSLIFPEPPRMVVSGEGNVGIGTGTPLERLDVRGGSVSIDNAGEGNVLLYLGTERHWQLRQLGTGSSTALELASVGGGGNKDFVVSTDGNVGIGTSSPESKLDVNGDLRVTGAYRGNIGPNGGAPFPRPAFDSDYVYIPQGTIATVNHGLGGDVNNYVVDVTCYDKEEYGPNHIFYGGEISGDDHRGLQWWGLTNERIIVARLSDDLHCDRYRVRIWVY